MVPVPAAGPETHLVGVWARRPDAAMELAGRLGVRPFGRYEDLVDACQAVAFSVPPAVQAELAATAARRGKALLLEKPVAEDLDGALRLADAVGEAGVVSQVVLSWRYAAPVRAFLEAAARLEVIGGRGGVGLFGEQGGGGAGGASWCPPAGIEAHVAGAAVYGPTGALSVDCAAAVGPETFAALRREFAEAVGGGTGHPLDVQHGLHLQHVIAAAEADLAGMGSHRAVGTLG